MADIRRRVEKRREQLLDEGEVALAACLAQPGGSGSTELVASATGGWMGARAVLRRAEGRDPGSGWASSMPRRRVVLAVTDRRLVAFAHDARGRPTEVVAAWPRSQVVAVAHERGLLVDHLQVSFGDGSSLRLDAQKGCGGPSVAAALAPAPSARPR